MPSLSVVAMLMSAAHGLRAITLLVRELCMLYGIPLSQESPLCPWLPWSHLYPMQYWACRNACACLGGLQWTIHRSSQVWIPQSEWIPNLALQNFTFVLMGQYTATEQLIYKNYTKTPPFPVHCHHSGRFGFHLQYTSLISAGVSKFGKCRIGDASVPKNFLWTCSTWKIWEL